LESVKTAADIYSPLDGTVHEVNEKLSKTPKLINTHSISQGWFAKLKVDVSAVKKELDTLMKEDAYNKYLEQLKH
jgi:glycine cleavage system H protein